MSAQATLPSKLRSAGYQFLPADTTTTKDIFTAASGTAPTGGSQISCLMATSTDTAAKDITLYTYDGSTARILATISIPANSGNTNALPPINLLTHSMLVNVLPRDSNGNPILILEQGFKLQGAMGSTITTAKVINIVAFGADH